MSALRSRFLWTIVAAGLAIRLVLAFAFEGTGHILIEELAANRVRAWNWHAVYESWTYPPLFLPWLGAASWGAETSGLPFHALAKLGPTIADVGLALAVYVYLGWRGAGERLRLIGVALVMLGPSFIVVSGYHGQIDSVAILPAVLAVMAWERKPSRTRAAASGLLVGLGVAIKIVPGLVALPLLACARSWREGAKLIVVTAGVPLLALAPLYLGGIDLDTLANYGGVPGFGGLSLVVDPGRGWDWLTLSGLPDPASGADRILRDNSRWITAFLLVLLSAFLFRYRPAPIDGAVLLWLAVFAFSPNFFLSYLVWALPFFIMAGYLKQTAILQAALLVPTVIYYLSIGEGVREEALAAIYVPMMIGLWAFWVIATFTIGARIVRQRESHPAGIQPPLAGLAPESA